MVAPGRWRDDGPQAARATVRAYSAVPALPVGQMVPERGAGPLPVTEATRRQRERRTTTKLGIVGGQTHARCLAWMPIMKEPCFRRLGHRGHHQTEASVVAGNAVRTAYRRQQAARP